MRVNDTSEQTIQVSVFLWALGGILDMCESPSTHKEPDFEWHRSGQVSIDTGASGGELGPQGHEQCRASVPQCVLLLHEFHAARRPGPACTGMLLMQLARDNMKLLGR